MRISLAIIILCVHSTHIHGITPIPLMPYRSVGSNTPWQLVGLTQLINQKRDDCYVVAAATPAYTQSVLENRIADCLFGNNLLTDTLSAINITGSTFANRNTSKDWLADYFGLPRDYDGTIRFEPIISNLLVDLYYYLALNHIYPGLYFIAQAPLVHTRWDLNFFEVIDNPGEDNYPSGYMNPDIIPPDIGVLRTDILNNFTQFVYQQSTPKLGAQTTMLPLKNARMVPQKCDSFKTKTGIASLACTLGWNMIFQKWTHVGVGLHVVAPTGNRYKSTFMFEPLIGNGGSWEVGAQLWAHDTFYHSENEERMWLWYILAHITHPFDTHATLTFDLKNKPNSRWMLASRFKNNVEQLRAAVLPNNTDPGNLSVPNGQFDNIFAPVANLTKRRVKLSRTLQLDATAMLTYVSRHLSVDFGWNIWFASCQHITPAPRCPSPLTQHNWALKGDSYMYGFANNDGVPTIPVNAPVALSGTQSNATIHEGANSALGPMQTSSNPGVDSRCFAVAVDGADAALLNNMPMNIMAEQTSTSKQPVYLTDADIDFDAGRTRSISNKLFIHISHAWFDYPHRCYVPFLGGGMSFELGNREQKQYEHACIPRPCQPCAVSQWAVWLKGGCLFN